MLLHERQEVAALQRQELDGLDRRDGGGARLRVEQRDLAEDDSRLEEVQDDFLRVDARDDAQAPPHYAIERRSLVALAKKHLARSQPARAGDAVEQVELALVKARENRDAREQRAPVDYTRLRHPPQHSPS